jgi:signal peptidase I
VWKDCPESGGLQAKPEELLSSENRASSVQERKCELVCETLRSSGTVRIRVTGRSMLPSIWPGDTLVIQQRNPGELRVGDILVYRQDQRLTAHRIMAISCCWRKFTLSARGDALPEPDSPVFNWQILGTVSRIIRNGKCLCPSSHLKRYERLIAIMTWRSDTFANFAVVAHEIFGKTWWSESRARAA